MRLVSFLCSGWEENAFKVALLNYKITIFPQVKIDFKLMMEQRGNTLHNNLLESWGKYSRIIMRKAFRKTKLREFDVNDKAFTEGKCENSIFI